MWVSPEQKELLTWNKKQLSSFLKGFQLSEVVSDQRALNYLVDTLKVHVNNYFPPNWMIISIN